ncbi:hypothetical protein N7470_009146 [Penicillium chermesinum]|nr:hypothetical protein N7470_009146 [Penicillium chermesinum]
MRNASCSTQRLQQGALQPGLKGIVPRAVIGPTPGAPTGMMINTRVNVPQIAHIQPSIRVPRYVSSSAPGDLTIRYGSGTDLSVVGSWSEKNRGRSKLADIYKYRLQNNPRVCWDDSSDVLQDIMVGHGCNAQEIPDYRLLALDDLDLDQFSPTDFCQWPLSDCADNLYSQHSQDAWTPLRLSTAPTGCQQSLLPDTNFGLYKTQYAAPSESGSHYMSNFSDSGYASTNGAPSLSHTVDSYSSPRMNFRDHALHDSMIIDQVPMASVPGLAGDLRDSSETSVRCTHPGCGWTGKCPSDKRKHEARHDKQYKCNEPGCTRKEGFGTANDLERHRKCVHGKAPERGPSVMYKCFGKDCPRAEKQWPRLDNFKQHLNRMHKNEDQKELLDRSNDWYKHLSRQTPEKVNVDTSMDDVASELQTFVPSQLGELEMDVRSSPMGPHGSDDVLSSRAATPRPYPSPSYPEASFLEGHQLVASPEIHTSWAQDRNELPGATSVKSEPTAANLPAPLMTYMTNLWNSHTRSSSQHSDEGIHMESESSQLSQLDRQQLQRFLEMALEKLPEEVPAEEANSRKEIQCHLCDKKTRLPCEMKKHQKRHERPYFCTFPYCGKAFGSKADWKRHEITQHLNESSWLCTSVNARTRAPCGTVFYQLDMYARHLSQQHNYTNDQIATAVPSGRLGIAANEDHFWCGFCRKHISISNSASSLNERFNHIDIEHFKKGERGDSWVFSDGSNMPGSEGQRKRKHPDQHSISDRVQ